MKFIVLLYFDDLLFFIHHLTCIHNFKNLLSNKFIKKIEIEMADIKECQMIFKASRTDPCTNKGAQSSLKTP